MLTFLLVVQAIVGVFLVGVILMQQSEGGGLGMGGSPTGLMSARGAADFLTRATTILATVFIGLSILHAVLATRTGVGGDIDTSLARKPAVTAPAVPAPEAPVPLANAPVTVPANPSQPLPVPAPAPTARARVAPAPSPERRDRAVPEPRPARVAPPAVTPPTVTPTRVTPTAAPATAPAPTAASTPAPSNAN